MTLLTRAAAYDAAGSHLTRLVATTGGGHPVVSPAATAVARLSADIGADPAE